MRRPFQGSLGFGLSLQMSREQIRDGRPWRSSTCPSPRSRQLPSARATPLPEHQKTSDQKNLHALEFPATGTKRKAVCTVRRKLLPSRRAPEMVAAIATSARAFSDLPLRGTIASWICAALLSAFALSVLPHWHELPTPTPTRLSHECVVTLVSSGTHHQPTPAPLVVAPYHALQLSFVPTLHRSGSQRHRGARASSSTRRQSSLARSSRVRARSVGVSIRRASAARISCWPSPLRPRLASGRIHTSLPMTLKNLSMKQF